MDAASKIQEWQFYSFGWCEKVHNWLEGFRYYNNPVKDMKISNMLEIMQIAYKSGEINQSDREYLIYCLKDSKAGNLAKTIKPTTDEINDFLTALYNWEDGYDS